MEETIEKTAEKPKEEPMKKPKETIKIASVIISRCKEGVEINMKSKVIEEFMKELFKEESAAGRTDWNKDEKIYKSSGERKNIEITSSRHTIRTDAENENWLMYNDETINMSFIKMVGLEKGKKIKFRGLFRESDIEAIAQSINEGLKNLFKEYNTPTCYEIEVTTEA